MAEEVSPDQGQATSESEASGVSTAVTNADAPKTGDISASEPLVVKEGKKGISQADLNKAAGKAREEGRQAATNELLRELGLDSPDTLKSIVQERKEAEEARQTELEKLQKQHKKVAEEREAYEAQVGDLQGQIKAMQLAQALQVQLIESGVNPERVTAAARLVDTDNLEIADDGSVTGLTDSIEAAKALAPELFAQPPRRVGSGSNPPVEPPDANPGFDTMPKEQFEELRHRVLMGQRIPLQ